MSDQTMDTVTIDNFRDKLSKWDEAQKQLFAIVDMGSNGIRFSISDLSPPRSRLLPCLYSERADISLYDALNSNSSGAGSTNPPLFSADIIAQVSKTLAHFKEVCDQFSVPSQQIDVIATAAMRSAANRADMLAAIKRESGLDVLILETATESLFGAMGARSGFAGVDGLVMDLGGGSCQMTYVDSGKKGYEQAAAGVGRSIPFGAANLTDALSGATSTAESDKVVEALKQAMREMYEGLKAESTELRRKLEDPEGVHIYMCGGGLRGYGSMLMHTHEIQPYPITSIAGFTVSGKRFARTEAMRKANESDDKIYGLSKRRRKQFPAIVTVVEALIAAVSKINAVTFSNGSNREGALFMKLSPRIRETHPLTLFPTGLSTPRPDRPSQHLSHARAFVESLLSAALPSPAAPAPFRSPEFVAYVAATIWTDLGQEDELNASRAVRIATTGHLADLPALTHELRAILALTLCARWDEDLGPADLGFRDRLRELLGKEASFWCAYLGTMAGFLSAWDRVRPVKGGKGGWAFNARNETSIKGIDATYDNDVGKHKGGVVVRFHMVRAGRGDGDAEGQRQAVQDAVDDAFANTGKGLGRKVRVASLELGPVPEGEEARPEGPGWVSMFL